MAKLVKTKVRSLSIRTLPCLSYPGFNYAKTDACENIHVWRFRPDVQACPDRYFGSFLASDFARTRAERFSRWPCQGVCQQDLSAMSRTGAASQPETIRI